MSRELDDDFFNRATAVINLVNEYIKTDDRQLVGASLMLASARFNSWVAAVANGSPEVMTADREQYIEGMTQYFRGLLQDQYDDYIANYDQYIREQKP